MIKAIKKLNDLLDKKSKVQFSLLLVLLLIKSILDGLGLGLLAPYITAISDSSIIFNHDVFKKINAYTNIDSSQQLILWMSIILFTFFLLKNIFTLLIVYYQARLVFTKRSLRGKVLFELYLKAPYSYHLEHNTAELDRNIRVENTNVYAFIQSLLGLCSNLLLLISISIVLLLTNWQALLVIVIMISFFSSIYLSLSSKYSYKLGKEVQSSILVIIQNIKEGLSSIVEAKLLRIESFFPNRYFRYMMINARANWQKYVLTAVPGIFFEILAVGGLVSIIITFSIGGLNINRLLPILGVFTFAFIRLIPSITAIIRGVQDLKFTMPSVEVIHADFENLKGLNHTNINNKVKMLDSMVFNSLRFRNATFSFPSQKNLNIIDSVNLNIKQGQAVGVTGPSGSGKTTLINMILGLLNPDSGLIYVNDEEMHKNLANWRSLIGYVPQSIILIDSSIKENVALGLEGDEINEKKVWAVLKEANLDVFVRDLPEQLDTFIGENGMRLSGGQRQRLGIARALYRDPEILIFDEATSSLDVETEKRITGEIMKLSGKRTLIIVAHRISTIKDCDVIYYLKNGRIENFGKFDELIELNEDFKDIAVHGDMPAT